MAEIWTMGEMIVEIMREKENEPLDKAGVFRGPYPSVASSNTTSPVNFALRYLYD